QFPWMFIGHGILLSISSAIVLCTPIVYKEWGMKAAVGLLVLLVGSHWIMDYNQIQVAYINAGNGPFMPHVILSAFGLVCAYILLDCTKRMKFLFLALMVACAVGSFYRITTLIEASSALDTFVAIFDYPHGRKDFGATYRMAGNGPGQIWAVLTGGELKDSLKEYYNYRPVAIPMLMALVTGVYCLFKLLGPLTEKLQPLWLVGRHSLGVYILHLIIIALTTVVLGSLRPFESGMSIQLYFVFVLVICYGYAFWKSKKGSLFSKKQSS
ncbi:MAG: hypothetical protein VX278_07560, partial [Myxococcota bacterium]|nr:hypothetical protein [Myxococcota bacterium]